MGDVGNYLIKNALWFILSTGLTYSLVKIKTLTKGYRAVQDMSMALTRSQVLRMYESAEAKGYRTDYSTIMFQQLVEAYYANGGNGAVVRIEEDYMNIKLKVEI